MDGDHPYFPEGSRVILNNGLPITHRVGVRGGKRYAWTT